MHTLSRVVILLLLIPSVLFSKTSRQEIDSINATSYDAIVSHSHLYVRVFQECLAAARALGYRQGEGKALSQLALAYYIRGNYDKSTECYLQCFGIFEELQSYHDLAVVYGEYGYQVKRRDMPKAVEYLRKAMHLAEEHQLAEDLRIKLYDNYGVLKEMQHEPDSARAYYTRALRMKEARADSIGIPYSLNNLASLYVTEGRYAEAEHTLALSDSIRRREQGSFGRAENLSLHGDLHAAQGNLDSALEDYQRCLLLSHAINYTYLVQYCYEQLTALTRKKGDFPRALEYSQQATAYKDSLANVQVQTTIAQLEVAYETAQKDDLIAKNELTIQRGRMMLVIAAASILLLGILSLWTYKYQQQKRVRLQREFALQSRLKEAELENAVASEKLRISRELHDNIGSRLTFVISSLDTLVFRGGSGGVTALSALRDFSRETLTDLRNTIWALKSEGGDVQELFLKVQELKQKIGASHPALSIQVERTDDAAVPLSAIHMLNLYRIVQEAMQNALKHSGATAITIRFGRREEALTLAIADNGAGFDVDDVAEGNGLEHMRARCEEAQGTFRVTSDGTGTRIECAIPVGHSLSVS